MAWLPEWIRYHLAIGFDHILIYDNNNGLENYPMPDEVISYCTGSNAKVNIVHKRNLELNAYVEFNKIDLGYDFKIMLKTDEFVSSKNEISNINELLANENSNLNVEIIPFDVINGEETLNIQKYKCYFPKYIKMANCKEEKETKKIYIKKILSIE